MTVCRNCENEFNGNYCPQCGQKAATHDVDSHYILHEAPHALLHIDKGIFYTIRELTARPGLAVLEYLGGKRVKHFSPIAYIVILSSVYLLLNKFTHGFGSTSNTTGNPEVEAKMRQIFGFILLSSTPFFALFYRMLFGKSKLNYWQFLVAGTFFTGHAIFILGIVRLLLMPFSEAVSTIDAYSIVAIPLYLILASYQMWSHIIRKSFCWYLKSSWQLP